MNVSHLSFVFSHPAECGTLASSLISDFITEARAQGILYDFCNPRSPPTVWPYDSKVPTLQPVSWGQVLGLHSRRDRASPGRALMLYRVPLSSIES